MTYKNLRVEATLTQVLALRQRLSTPNEQDQEEQEYLSELIQWEIEPDPEDRRPRKWKPQSLRKLNDL